MPAPVFFHNPSTDDINDIGPEERDKFKRYSTSLIEDQTPWKVPTDTAFITYSNNPEKILIEKLYEAHQIPYITVAKDYMPWNWLAKVEPVLKFLKEHQGQYKYAVVTDGNDVIMTRPPEDLLDNFESYNCDVLLGNTCRNWPRDTKLSAFEKERYSQHQDATHYHISAGFLMGRPEALIRCYAAMCRFGMWHALMSAWVKQTGRPGLSFFFHPTLYFRLPFAWKHWFDDQHAWRRLHRKHYPRIKCDYKGLILQRFDRLFLTTRQENSAPPAPWDKC